jgi:beta-phosphoglucomutase-like phosphatase (HAD superfamily)
VHCPEFLYVWRKATGVDLLERFPPHTGAQKLKFTDVALQAEHFALNCICTIQSSQHSCTAPVKNMAASKTGTCCRCTLSQQYLQTVAYSTIKTRKVVKKLSKNNASTLVKRHICPELNRTANRLPSSIPPTALAASNNNDISAPVVKAILFDMDGVLCESEHISRQAACEVMKELYNLDVQPDEFIPFTGTGEANFLGGVATKYGAPFNVDECKSKFFEIYMTKYALPGSGIGCPGAKELVAAARAAGLKTAVASSADRVKVDVNLSAADIPQYLFDTIVSADAFEKLKPSPDIFLAASKQLGVPPSECVVIEDAVAGVQAARAAKMRVIGVTTSLSVEAMEEAGPDRIFKGIGDISLEDVLTLKENVQQKV